MKLPSRRTGRPPSTPLRLSHEYGRLTSRQLPERGVWCSELSHERSAADGAGGGTRTPTVLPPPDFESGASAISPLRHHLAADMPMSESRDHFATPALYFD
jgi:hypothetical protein